MSNEGTKNSEPGAIVILGASYAERWMLPPVAGRPVVNKGIGGQESWQLLERFDRDVASLAPSAVIVWGYINDVFRSPPEQVDAALARACESFEQIVAKARACGIEPIVATEVTLRPRDTWGDLLSSWVGRIRGKESYQAYVNARVLRLNDWLRGLARREALLLLDLQPVLSDDSGQRRREFATEDGSHITPAAYAALGAYAMPLLQQHFDGARGNTR